ncbi:MAG: MFS transporter [Nibricoccus sp.]
MNFVSRASKLLLPVIYLGFISLGLPDGVLGVAWPSMRQTLGLPLGLAGTLLLVVTLLSGVSSFSSGRILARFRTGPVVMASCALTGSALLLISQARGAAWLFAAAVPLGFGAGAVDAGLNAYVARNYSGRHMNWLHACWGIGATCGPVLMTFALTHAIGWRGGYFALGTIQLCLAAIFLFTLGLWAQRSPSPTVTDPLTTAKPNEPSAKANSEAGWLSATIFALYVAVEATAGLWAYTLLTVGRGLPQSSAGTCVAFYYGSITGGRIVAGLAVERLGNRQIVKLGLGLASVGALLLTCASDARAAGIALALIGVGFAPVYPCLMHEVPKRFATSATFTVIGRQSGAAYIGGATMPALIGWLTSVVSLESICWILLMGIASLVTTILRLDRIT